MKTTGEEHRVLSWRGAAIEKMSREELIEVVNHLARELDEMGDYYRDTLRVMRELYELRRRPGMYMP
jgi:hypothetical protein